MSPEGLSAVVVAGVSAQVVAAIVGFVALAASGAGWPLLLGFAVFALCVGHSWKLSYRSPLFSPAPERPDARAHLSGSASAPSEQSGQTTSGGGVER